MEKINAKNDFLKSCSKINQKLLLVTKVAQKLQKLLFLVSCLNMQIVQQK